MKRTIISLVSLFPLTFAACGGTSDGGDCTASAGGSSSKYVTSSVMVPQQRQDYAIDLNGDGRVDNQLGNIIGALEGQMLHVQDGVNTAVTDGTLIVLMNETSSDATFQSDACATASLQVGQSQKMPDYTSGMGQFTVDSAQQGGTFNGPIKAGKFSSSSPATTTKPVTVVIKLPLVAGAEAVTLKVNGAHLQFTRGADGKITGGQLNGAIKNEDVQNSIIPNVATLLTNKVKSDNPQTSADAQILSIFDNGGKADAACATGTCKNPAAPIGDGSCAVKNDGKIDICEVSTAGLIQNVLAPDVQMFDAAGGYKPNKDNTMKDSLSIGLSFTMVGAKF
ncbi:MAG: hypothetical protein JWN44_3680 [Myxococcales bacterium]|nr:hypothetical protein [Myxococcales bacterium]